MTHLQHADFADDADILSWIPSDHLHARHSKQAPLLALNQMAGYIYIKTEKRGNIIRYCPAHRGSRIACTRRNSNEIPTPIWTIVIRIGISIYIRLMAESRSSPCTYMPKYRRVCTHHHGHLPLPCQPKYSLEFARFRCTVEQDVV